MEKDKILAAAKRNSEKSKEFEKSELTKSNLIGFFASITVCIILYFFEFFINHSVNLGIVAVGMTAAGVQSLNEGIRLKKRGITIAGIIISFIAIISIALFVIEVVAK